MTSDDKRREVAHQLQSTSYDSLGSEPLQRALARITEAKDANRAFGPLASPLCPDSAVFGHKW